MDARISEGRSLSIAGLSFFGDPFSSSAGWTEENEIGRLWSRFQSVAGGSGIVMPESSEPGRMYEVHVFGSEMAETGQYEVFVGYPVNEVAHVPPLLNVKILPESRMAWFTLEGEAIVGETGYDEMDRIIADEGLMRSGTWFCNVYDERFKGMDRLNESAIDVCIPVR